MNVRAALREHLGLVTPTLWTILLIYFLGTAFLLAAAVLAGTLIRRHEAPREVTHFVIVTQINCDAFETAQAADQFVRALGGDYFGLDGDHDGHACEGLE